MHVRCLPQPYIENLSSQDDKNYHPRMIKFIILNILEYSIENILGHSIENLLEHLQEGLFTNYEIGCIGILGKQKFWAKIMYSNQ